MSANEDSNTNDDRKYVPNPHSSGMTPSIITTINNTSPINTACNNNHTNTISKSRRTIEPFYESYIEDSFVGHWEREDDDPNEPYHGGHGNGDANAVEDDEPALPSTIEFDFDSFGPESFIYTPAATKPSTQSHEKEPNKEEKQTEMEEAKGPRQTEAIEREETPAGVTNSTQPSVLNPEPLDLVDNVQIDLKVIEPYKKVISHAGYCHHLDPSAPAPKPGEPAPAIIVFSACYLPDRSRRDYNYVMDHLFLYVLSSLHELIADDYILIYLHNTHPSNSTGSVSSKTSSSSNLANGSSSSTLNEDTQSQNNLPTFTWMKRCYQMIDRKLRKNLKILYLVKPTFWLKTIVIMCKPFISTKFSKKLRFVESMDGLKKCLPVDKLILPASAQDL